MGNNKYTKIKTLLFSFTINVSLLQPICFKLQKAANRIEAIEWQEWQPHLIWMDTRMPVMNGYQATERIKSQLKGQATYIIALTTSTFEEEKVIVLLASCDDFARKPFQEHILFDKMAQYLGINYVYAQESEAIQTNFLLESAALKLMPSEWLTQLKEAASELNEDLITDLLAQIPNEHTLLPRTLQNKVNDFNFDEIVKSIEQTAKISK